MDAFLNRTLNRNELFRFCSSGGPTSILFSMHLLIEMSSGGPRALEARDRCFLNRSLNKTELSSLYSSGGLKSMLSSMQLLVEMSSGVFRAPKARDPCFCR